MAGSRDRERRRARERYERQRQAQLARRRKLRQRLSIGVAVACAIGLIVGLSIAFVGGGSPPKASAKATSTASATATATATASAAAVSEPATHCTYTTTTTGDVVKASLPPSTPNYKATYTATINTNLGKVNISLLNSKATCTVNSFVHLAETGYLDNTQCWRVSDSGGLYMLQCGDPTAKAADKLSCSSSTLGTGGPGYEFDDENLTGATYNAGTVAMANSGANTNGSQFFLVFKNSTGLSPDYTPFGTITSGLDILQNVGKAGTSCTLSAGGGVPKEKVVITSVTIKQT